MRGHFKKRGERWYFWVELAAAPDGRRRQKSVGGFRTRKEAEEAFARFRDSVRLGDYLEPTKLSVEEYLTKEWLPAVRVTIRPSSASHYTLNVRYAVRYLGRLRLDRLRGSHLNAFYAKLLAEGRSHTPGGLSPKSVRHVHTTLHKALADAVRWGLLSRNPADQADPPVPRRADMRIWSPEQLRAFLASVAEDRLYAAWLLLITTGMRRGELVGLRWDDLDLDSRVVSVVRALVVVDGRALESEPKTARGRRLLPLDPVTAAALRGHRRRQMEERLHAGPAWQETGLVFVREDGSAIHPDRLYDWFNQRRRAAGLPAIRLHGLRHSYASAALKAGAPAKVVSERLGHANVNITLDTYSHVLPGIQEEMADRVARVILEGDDQSRQQERETPASRHGQ